LFVDDDPSIHRSLRAVFPSTRPSWRFSFAQSAAEGLRCLEQDAIDVVVSDNAMSPMTGVEMLEIIAVRYPAVGRCLWSGTARPCPAADVFVAKPGSVAQVEAAVEIAIKKAELRSAALRWQGWGP